jgi:hypothetical protein
VRCEISWPILCYYHKHCSGERDKCHCRTSDSKTRTETLECPKCDKNLKGRKKERKGERMRRQKGGKEEK